MVSSGPEKKEVQVAISLFYILKETRRKSASLEPLIGHLALVIGKLCSNKIAVV